MNALDTPMYTPSMVGRLAGLHPQRVRRWLLGYQYSYGPYGGGTEVREQRPVLLRQGADGSRYASFLDLVDLLFVKRLLDHGLSLQKLRRALEEAAELTGGHYFAQRPFFTDGRQLWLQIRDDADALLELVSNGQWVIAPVIEQVAHQFGFEQESGFAERCSPMSRDKHVVVDPTVAFGAPSVQGRAIKTANVFDLYIGEDRRIDVVSDWLELTAAEVEASVAFEQALRAA
jgi:uncharacterized protein (DUF433 family)/DNA-binding transcriptional MerR regulator